MALKRKVRPATYGLMAEFDNPSDAVAAARRVHEEGYTKIDAFSPYPVEELSEAIGVHQTYMPHVVLAGGILGGLAGYLMQFYIATLYYPINVGGSPCTAGRPSSPSPSSARCWGRGSSPSSGCSR